MLQRFALQYNGNMPQPFLEVFPREIRDQIYTYILASPSGLITLSPWTVEVARSLWILRTCKQVHREVKDIIWHHKGLNLREPTQLSQKLKTLSMNKQVRRIRQLNLCLELLDRDELEWMVLSLPALLGWCRAGRLEAIVLSATWEKPSSVLEYKEVVALRKEGERLDGRLYLQEPTTWTSMLVNVNTGWPRFSHWGKQRWLREMLLDPNGIDELLEEIHSIFSGQLFVDGVLCFNNHQKHAKGINLDPRNGEVRIIPSSSSR